MYDRSHRVARGISLWFRAEIGLVHKDATPQRLGDENYISRNAFLHGQMRRSYGPKDSSKTFLLIMFVVFAFDSLEEGSDDLCIDR
jgi:hypothetical protein